MEQVLDGLNKAQLEAVQTTEGYVRVIAGAGSGKTRALSRRFAYLVNDIGILPSNILCVTFTNKAANEMRQRIHALTGDRDTGIINTFHGFCVEVLHEESSAVQYPKNFLVLDNADINAMLQTIYDERGLGLRDMTFGKARDMIEMKKLFQEPDYYLDMLTMDLETLKQKYENATDKGDIIFYGYLYQEKKCFGFDYNDLLTVTLYIFQQNEDIRLKWQKRLEYIMIDEFQDIDELQYKLMSVLCAYHKNLFVVGDPDQTIYTWRGANVKYLLDFDKNFPGTKTVMMMRNYRSTPQILGVANALIDKNTMRIKKSLVHVRPDGGEVLCNHSETSDREAEWICRQIQKLHDGGVPYRNAAVLYRANYVTRPLENIFGKNEIPYTVYSGARFYDRKEVKDALSYLRMTAYKDDLSFARVVNVPKRNIGQRRMKFLQDTAEREQYSLYEALCANLDNDLFKGTGAVEFHNLIEDFSAHREGRPVSELLSAILNESGYERMLRTEGSQERLDDLAELKQSIYEFEVTCGEETTLEGYLSHVALFSNSDMADAGDKVRLMTIHMAKGLEFPNVFLCALNEGILPSRKTKTLQGMEEERRLAFVAVTRAGDRLYLSECEGRTGAGSPVRYPSRFLLELDPGLVTYDHAPRAALLAEARQYVAMRSSLLTDAESGTFARGQRVTHPVFGAGTVMGIDTERACYEILFDTMNTTRDILFRAKLTAI